MSNKIERLPFWVRTLIIPAAMLYIVPYIYGFLIQAFSSWSNNFITGGNGGPIFLTISNYIKSLSYPIIYSLMMSFFICFCWKKATEYNAYWKTALLVFAFPFAAFLLSNLQHVMPNMLLASIIGFIITTLLGYLAPVFILLILRLSKWFKEKPAPWLPLSHKKPKISRIVLIIVLVLSIVLSNALDFIWLYSPDPYDELLDELLGVLSIIVQPLLTAAFTFSVYRLFLAAPVLKAENAPVSNSISPEAV